MDYQMAATAVTLNGLEGHSQVACLFKCNPSNIYAEFYMRLYFSGVDEHRIVKFVARFGP